MTPKRLLPVLFWTTLALSFVILASSVSLVAAGYQFDWKTKRLTQTGLIYLAGEPRQVKVTINGEVAASRLPLRLSTVLPGDYEILIEKEGYVPWRKHFTVQAGEAHTETDLQLFLVKPEIATVSDPATIRKVEENTALSPLINGQEIRLGSRLVTRVSGELGAAAISPNRSHVFFQIGREIRVIEADGTNELLLYTLATDAPSHLIVLEDGQEVVLLDGAEVIRLRVG
jgi:hypothetical protein